METITCLSGKGGVGKTTVSVSLALSLKKLGYKVGLVDIDLHGPNIHVALKIPQTFALVDSRTRSIEPIIHDGLKVWSIAFMLPDKMPVMFKGELKKRVVQQFVTVINWGELDYLVADLPPGTGEETAGVIEYLKPTGAVAVTTPSDLSLEDYYRVRTMLDYYKIPLLLTIVNMGMMKCPHCRKAITLFKDAQVDGEVVRVPFDPEVAESKLMPKFDSVAQKVLKRIAEVKPLTKEVATK